MKSSKAEMLGRKTPNGYYLIVARIEAQELISKISGIRIEQAGDIILIKVKSRRIAKKIYDELSRRNLLIT